MNRYRASNFVLKVYVFGNQDIKEDNQAFKVAQKLNGIIDSVEFIKVLPNQDLPFVGQNQVVILDTIQGIDKITVLSEKDLEKIILSTRNTVHDFDLGFQLKYLQKLGKLCKFVVIGIPQKGRIDYTLIQSILRKLVAQDIQGS